MSSGAPWNRPITRILSAGSRPSRRAASPRPSNGSSRTAPMWREGSPHPPSPPARLVFCLHPRPIRGFATLATPDNTDGDHQAKLQDTLGKIELAKRDRDSGRERASWSRRMWKPGFMSKTQADADQSRQESADYSLTKLET